MKKSILSLLLTLLLLTGCAAGAQEQVSLTDRATAVLQALTAGEYSRITGQFDDAMRAAVNDEALSSGWQNILMQLGALTGVLEAQENAETGSAALLLSHERGQSTMMLAFDAQGRISSMYISAGQQTQALERTLPQGAQAIPVTLFEGTERALPGEVILPVGADENTPCVVLVQGSGPSDMDETMGANKPFRDIAYDLAALGVSTLRFDKITYAHPELPVITVDDEYLVPVTEALRVAREATRASRVFIAGHSQGGMLAPYLTQACGFDGAIVMAGTPFQLWEVSYAQNLALINSLPADQREAVLAQVEGEAEKARAIVAMSEADASTQTAFGMNGAYLRHMAQIDEIDLVQRSDKPFLFLWGDRDSQVDVAMNGAWQEALSQNSRCTFITYEGLNHIFQTAQEGESIATIMAAYSVPGQVDARVAQDIAAFVRIH